jgi:predicted phage baseplate assembly protein
LTYVTAPTPSGAASTLQVRVNDLLWHEAPTLYGRGPHDRVFITRTAADGKTTVQFGDGITGARLPGGQENVRASYRKGIGLGGLVKAEQLSLLMTRPLGLKEVINPLAADGADDPESLDEARHNAPLTMLTFDRIVSLQDYEDFAHAYAGIAKALATWTWDGRRRGVFVTVAGPGGAAVKPDSNLHTNLLAAMQQAGDPFVPLEVASYRQALFRIAGSIKVDPDYQPDKVLAAVEQALRGHFSFEARSFGQPVMLSEVIAVIHTAPGVVAVDLDKFERTDAPAPSNLKQLNLLKLFPGKSKFQQPKSRRLVLAQLTLKHRLTAQTPTAGADREMAAAELLTLDPAPLELGGCHENG